MAQLLKGTIEKIKWEHRKVFSLLAGYLEKHLIFAKVVAAFRVAIKRWNSSATSHNQLQVSDEWHSAWGAQNLPMAILKATHEYMGIRRREKHMIPLKDTTPRRSVPVMTLLLIVVNVGIFIHQIALGAPGDDTFIRTYGLVPDKIQLALSGHQYTFAQAFLPLFTCMFLHGGFLHILGNMWFLWIFGANVEDRFGSVPYLFFYLLCGLGSGVSQVLFSWGSHVPSLGASGAISGVLGAYIVFFPGSRILTLIPLFIIWFTVRVPAMIFIGLWFLMQFLSGLSSLSATSGATGGVAWWAHVGGFLLGAAFAWASSPSRHRSLSW
jgi:membrane associated rhomboid family serine protease